MLFLAFGTLLALMLFAGFSALRSLRQLDALERSVNDHYSRHEQALTTILISVHVYHDQMERYLFTPDNPDTAAADLQSRAAEVRNSLQKYPADGDPEEQALLAEILSRFNEQESAFAILIQPQPGQRPADRQQQFGEQMMLRRAYILQASRGISTLNQRELVAAQQSLAANFRSVQTRLMNLIAISLLAGLLMSLLGGFYVLRLERKGRLRYQQLVASRRELEALSARIVDAQEEERRSISRELHDEVGQTLGALLVDLGQLSRLVPSGNDQLLQNQIARIKSVAEHAVKSIRDMALLLRPPMLDDLGLLPALEWQAREVSRRGDMEVDVHSQSLSEQLPDEIKVCVYRLVQEALTNAARHAAAKHAVVTVKQENARIHLTIADDGKGFSPDRTRGMGILGMEERVKRLGGTLHIHSAPGKGATVEADIPLPDSIAHTS